MCPTPLRLSHFFTPLTWTQVSIQHFVFSPTRKWFLMIALPLNLTCSVFILPVNIGSLNCHPRFPSGTSVSPFNSFLQLSTFLSSDTNHEDTSMDRSSVTSLSTSTSSPQSQNPFPSRLEWLAISDLSFYNYNALPVVVPP